MNRGAFTKWHQEQPEDGLAESIRLAEDSRRERNWKRWGPYLPERQWGTVREDYSPSGTCWEYFPHDHARSHVYRWGEDGLLGWCDRECRLCLAPALWNGKDPILRDRLFGLTNGEGNHGEDVKECYFYLDATPTKRRSTNIRRPSFLTPDWSQKTAIVAPRSIGATSSCSVSTSMETTAGDVVPAIKPGGPLWSPGFSGSSAPVARSGVARAMQSAMAGTTRPSVNTGQGGSHEYRASDC